VSAGPWGAAARGRRRAPEFPLWGAVALAGVLLAAPGAGAVEYANAPGHYGFAAPDGWTQGNQTGVDAVFAGPEAGGFKPNVVASHEVEVTAQNSSVWLRAYVEAAFGVVNASMNVSVVQGPRTFTTGSGRLAGDYVYDWQPGAAVLRQRQVLFVSEFHTRVYVLTLTDQNTTFNAHAPEWAQVVDSFHVEGERTTRPPPAGGPPPAGSDDTLVLIAGAMAVAGAVMVAVAFVRMRGQRAPPVPPAQAAFPAPAAPRPPPATPGRPPAPGYGARPPPAYGGPPPPAVALPGDEPRRSPRRDAWSPPAAPGAPPAPPRALLAAPPPAWSGGMPPPGTVVGATAAAPPARTRPAVPPATPPAFPPAARPAAPPVPRAAAPPARGRAALIRCPKCATQFPGPETRPATVLCPNCGTKGVMK